MFKNLIGEQQPYESKGDVSLYRLKWKKYDIIPCRDIFEQVTVEFSQIVLPVAV